MKKTLKLIAMLLCVATMTSMWSCDTNQSSSSSGSNNPTSIQKNENVEPQKTGFTASNGRFYSFSEVEKEFHDRGTSEGTKCQGFGYHFSSFGTEECFKKHWVSAYGIPESPEAKDAYSRALKKYQEGYDAGYKF